MQFVAAHAVSSAHIPSTYVFDRLPIDPTLGETAQFIKKDGTTFTSEAIQL